VDKLRLILDPQTRRELLQLLCTIPSALEVQRCAARTGRSEFTMVRPTGLQLLFLVMIQARAGPFTLSLSVAWCRRLGLVLIPTPAGSSANVGHDRSIGANLLSPATLIRRPRPHRLAQNTCMGGLSEIDFEEQSIVACCGAVLRCLIIPTILTALSLLVTLPTLACSSDGNEVTRYPLIAFRRALNPACKSAVEAAAAAHSPWATI